MLDIYENNQILRDEEKKNQVIEKTYLRLSIASLEAVFITSIYFIIFNLSKFKLKIVLGNIFCSPFSH